MASRMDEFRKFVSTHPLVRDEVKNGSKSWQSIYEDWVILGEEDSMWEKYKVKSDNKQESKKEEKKIEDLLTSENLKNIWGYLKKINPDTISKTLNTVQKVLQITQSFGGKSSSGLYNANYNSWWD